MGAAFLRADNKGAFLRFPAECDFGRQYDKI